MTLEKIWYQNKYLIHIFNWTNLEQLCINPSSLRNCIKRLPYMCIFPIMRFVSIATCQVFHNVLSMNTQIVVQYMSLQKRYPSYLTGKQREWWVSCIGGDVHYFLFMKWNNGNVVENSEYTITLTSHGRHGHHRQLDCMFVPKLVSTNIKSYIKAPNYFGGGRCKADTG